MSVTSDFYTARADECARDAENSQLENVRDRFRRSEAAWRSMAERVMNGEQVRAADAARKTEERAA